MGRSMICAAIKGPSYAEVEEQLKLAQTLGANLVEWRLDLFSTLDLDKIETLKKQLAIPSLFTLRAERQGGSFKGAESARLTWLQQLAQLEPEYMDFEWDVPVQFLQQMAAKHPGVKQILSYHDFHSTPENLEQLFREQLFSQISSKPAHLYKIATMAHSTIDAMRMLLLSKQHAGRLIALCMGELGQLTRIAGPLFGTPLCYAALKKNEESAQGQLTIEELLEFYHYPTLSPATKLLGLIGDPVESSLSHYTHNYTMQQLGLDALYVKMQVKEQELAQFMRYAVQLQFSGLSITMPLKEKALAHLDQIEVEAAKIGAVNTLVFKNNKIYGSNTDGIGALNSLEEVAPVAGQTVLILGAGGAARAIAYETLKRHAYVIVLNRDPKRAQELAAAMGHNCIGAALDQMQFYADRYQFIINATPAALPIDPHWIKAGMIAMDIKSKPLMPPFLAEAATRGAICIPGYRMFIYQAVEQFRRWFGPAIDPAAILHHLEKAIKGALPP